MRRLIWTSRLCVVVQRFQPLDMSWNGQRCRGFRNGLSQLRTSLKSTLTQLLVVCHSLVGGYVLHETMQEVFMNQNCWFNLVSISLEVFIERKVFFKLASTSSEVFIEKFSVSTPAGVRSLQRCPVELPASCDRAAHCMPLNTIYFVHHMPSIVYLFPVVWFSLLSFDNSWRFIGSVHDYALWLAIACSACAFRWRGACTS